MDLLPKVLKTAMPIVVLFLVPLLSKNVVLGSDLIAIDPERLQLIKDALSWMTFRKNGILMTNQEVEDFFLDTIKEKYSTFKFYRTFVIAFQRGVLPRLTLKDGAVCDPGYTFKYKDTINGSVTWFYQKKFTFESYHNRDDPSIRFCDYREGLVCNAATKKCQCPDGTTMSPIEPSSSVKRCLLRKGEVCALMDMNHERPHEFQDLKRLLPRIMFNLEKPESCEIGTQCRFIGTQEHLYTAKCHDSNTDPSTWFPQLGGGGQSHQGIPFAKECSIGLYSYSGGCDTPGGYFDKNRVGNSPGYLCYNFGPPRSVGAAAIGVTNRTGFCAHDVGSYGIAEQQARGGYLNVLWKYNFVMGFVHRRTVPFDETELKNYYKRYLDEVYGKLFTDLGGQFDHLERDAGNPCNVGNTQKLEVIWKYYQALEEDPLPGQDFVPTATKTELHAKLQELIDLVNGLASDEKICKVFWSGYYWEKGHSPNQYDYNKYVPALHCVTSPTPVGSNDGTCEDSKDNSTLAYAVKLQEYSKDLEGELRQRSDKDQEQFVDESILRDNPEPPCTKKSAQSGRRRRDVHEHKDTLEDGGCPQDFVCWEDWSDSNGLYDSSCDLATPNPTLRNRCHDSKDGVKYDRCEGQQLDVLIESEMEKMVDFSTLERGENCKRDLEDYFKDWRENGPSTKNKYKFLSTLQYEKKVNGQGLCDRTKLLECGASGVCECVQNTEPRKADVELASFSVQEYQSDYCYLASGACTQDPTTLMPFTMTEKQRVQTHYGSPEGDCTNGNVCVYVDKKGKLCTTVDTGSTGHDFVVVPPKVTPKPGPGNGKGGGGRPGKSFAGGSRQFDRDFISMWILSAMLAEIVLWL